MTTIGKVWTAGIAYVALAVGAGLSIMYNILDTIQVRGPEFDWADLVTAIAAPAIVLLMVEMFVSRIWVGQNWHIQIIRYLATVAIGGVAMRTSWTHGHDFMTSRGQSADVATLWPLAIDLLAIMATALILAGRTRGHVAMTNLGDVADTMATERTYGHGQEMATLTLDDGRQWTGPVAKDVPPEPQPEPQRDPHPFGGDKDVPPPWTKEPAPLPPWHEDMASAVERYATKVAEDPALATDHPAGLPPYGPTLTPEPVATQPLSPEYAATLAAELDAWGTAPEPRTFTGKVPNEAVAMIREWDPARVTSSELDILLAAYFEKSQRTIRRWRSLVTGVPTSGT